MLIHGKDFFQDVPTDFGKRIWFKSISDEPAWKCYWNLTPHFFKLYLSRQALLFFCKLIQLNPELFLRIWNCKIIKFRFWSSIFNLESKKTVKRVRQSQVTHQTHQTYKILKHPTCLSTDIHIDLRISNLLNLPISKPSTIKPSTMIWTHSRSTIESDRPKWVPLLSNRGFWPLLSELESLYGYPQKQWKRFLRVIETHFSFASLLLSSTDSCKTNKFIMISDAQFDAEPHFFRCEMNKQSYLIHSLSRFSKLRLSGSQFDSVDC